MKQLLILSGKGGTGKTTIASSFIELGKIKAYADCDVDAPNLGLILQQESDPIKRGFFGMNKANIDTSSCISCGLCLQHCAFKAIDIEDNQYIVNPYLCEGCSVCERLCPQNAIHMIPNKAGNLELYKGSHIFSTAKLKIGEGNSGLLVTEVKKGLKSNVSKDIDIAIIDGSPGIGCPVIASINDVDMILIVTEPSFSGLSDLKRIVSTGERFNKKMGICINKYDINEDMSLDIEEYSKRKNIEILGKIPYYKEILNNLNKGKTAMNANNNLNEDIKKLYDKTIKMLLN